ncbi:MAG: hypothetical protein KatS3mg104_0702 [Phycisphaerae bacterium]|nr:MAG: hypothetical protein KatS3mg104_0702 [Phycisphaerae bacterium]
MKRLLPYLIGLSVALWLGGLITLFISLISIFRYNRGIGAQVGPILFSRFEPYQIGLGLIAVVLTFVWRMYSCSRAKKILLISLILAVTLSTVSYTYLTPQIMHMTTGQVIESGERFAQLHKTSEKLYNLLAVLVLVAFVSFIAAVRSESASGLLISQSTGKSD